MARDEYSSNKKREKLEFEMEDNDPLINKERHKNKRRMAWISLMGMFAIFLLIFYGVEAEKVDQYSTILGVLFPTLSAVILTYMGVTSYHASVFEKNRRREMTDDEGGHYGS